MDKFRIFYFLQFYFIQNSLKSQFLIYLSDNFLSPQELCLITCVELLHRSTTIPHVEKWTWPLTATSPESNKSATKLRGFSWNHQWILTQLSTILFFTLSWKEHIFNCFLSKKTKEVVVYSKPVKLFCHAQVDIFLSLATWSTWQLSNYVIRHCHSLLFLSIKQLMLIY